MKPVLALATLALSAFLAPAAAAQPEPTLHDDERVLIGKPAQPKPKIYDEKGDAAAAIDGAIAKAARDNKRVLIQWGANWCPWCHLLHGTFKSDAKVARKLMYEYEVVLVDSDHNPDLPVTYKADLRKNGIPFITILGADGKVVVNQETSSLEDPDKANPHHDAAKVLAFLTEHQAVYPKAEDLLDKGVIAAQTSGKKVFLHFGAPWCGWCHRLEDWMATPKVAAILAKDFVDVKIDTDRTVGGSDMLKKFCGTDKSGIPWFVILDASDSAHPKAIVTSDAPGEGNIGYPGEPAEIDHFIAMMKKAAFKMTPSDIEALRDSLSEKAPPPIKSNDQQPVPMVPIRPAPTRPPT